MIVTIPHRWRKSSHSGSQTSCVELAHTLNRVRDSKNTSGPALPVTGLVEFLNQVKQGRFDR